MKAKKLIKKLNLHKDTIAHLDNNHLNQIKGGTCLDTELPCTTWEIPCDSRPITCTCKTNYMC